ncbi:hypothetical protein BDV93DRAFT_607102 [Ceratobasidium sp. AG-I]|nr:hypothetical protein BDV93DRAFT_607102 [Ceratobasidium sp. AG-I]
MAMLHPDDEHYWIKNALSDDQINSLFSQKCGSTTTTIVRPKDLGAAYHAVIFCRVSLDSSKQDILSHVVLRVSRPCIPRTKTENEVVAIMQHLRRHTKIPVPDIYFWDNMEDNVLGHEYICMERILHPSLDKMFGTLSEAALERVLSQLVDFFIQLRRVSPSSGRRMFGGLQFDKHIVLASLPGEAPSEKYVIPGPIVEETFWQIPDVKRYWNDYPDSALVNITFDDLNVRGPFDNWPSWVHAWLKKYEMQVIVHPRLEFCRARIAGSLQKLIVLLEAPEPASWLQELRRKNGGGSLYLSMKDLHGGNVLVDEQGTIHAFSEHASASPSMIDRSRRCGFGRSSLFFPAISVVQANYNVLTAPALDWEFAGFVPSFAKEAHPVKTLLSMAKYQLSPNPVPPALDTWSERFSELFEAREPVEHAMWLAEIEPRSLGEKGEALHELWNFLRSVIEVCVRGEGNVSSAKGAWLDRVVAALETLVG